MAASTATARRPPKLYALLSALAEVPLRQDLAVTGSVDQHGKVQAIGGVNQKIEGFFDVCAARGLTGTQGVMIPQSNAQHLMLRADVVEACAAGRFAVYPIHTIDQGIQLLTGRAAGERGADGQYPEASVNRLVEDRLAALPRRGRRWAGRSRRRVGCSMSMSARPQHHRVILHLHYGAAMPVIIQAAAELAQLLGLDAARRLPAGGSVAGTCGAAVRPRVPPGDRRLAQARPRPLVREQRLGGERGTTAARRGRHGARLCVRLFEVISGDPLAFIAAASQTGDIIVVAQPRLPAEHLVYATARLARGSARLRRLGDAGATDAGAPAGSGGRRGVCRSRSCIADRGAPCRGGARGSAAAGLRSARARQGGDAAGAYGRPAARSGSPCAASQT